MAEDRLVEFFAYETIGVGRGPVGLEPMFQAIDAYFKDKDTVTTDRENDVPVSSIKSV